MRILVVEDDRLLNNTLCYKQSGSNLDCANDFIHFYNKNAEKTISCITIYKISSFNMEVITWEISCIGYIGEWPTDCGKAVAPA